jgi:SMP-30/Gluconolactonase/LRE-like region
MKTVSLKMKVCLAALVLVASVGVQGHRNNPGHRPEPTVDVFARGLDNPRGLAFGPDGTLYVAEAGSGGTESTASICPELQIGPPYGPYTNGPTARISAIDRHGERRTLVDALPSGQSQVPDWQGVADVAFMGHRLFALVQGGGCSYGSARFPKSIIEIDPRSGRWRQVADLSAFRRAHPVTIPDDDLEPEGVYYNLEAAFGKLYVLDANGGRLLEVRLDGRVRIALDFTARYGHITPTALTQLGPFLIVGNLFQFPIVDGASGLYAVSPFGFAKQFASGLTAVVDVTVDCFGRLYALEMGNGQGSGFPDPEAGRIVRVHPSGRKEVVVTGLTFPTGMTFGHDRRLYVSNRGFDTPPTGTGEILVVDLDGR